MLRTAALDPILSAMMVGGLTAAVFLVLRALQSPVPNLTLDVSAESLRIEGCWEQTSQPLPSWSIAAPDIL